ncbi:MAG: GNVR domain-containing protein, partial [Elusimicrobiota bacterium]|nr:GNVR domain-containing protein [Elusimicrobiota bacterium]
IASAAKLGDIRVISKAVVPGSPVSPNKKKIVGVAASAGFFLGIAAAFAAGFIEKQKFPV